MLERPCVAPRFGAFGTRRTRCVCVTCRHVLLTSVRACAQEHDLSIQNRDKTNDKVTYDAAHAILKCNVGIKVRPCNAPGAPRRT